MDAQTAHEDLHSEQGAERGDRPGRAKNPVIKVEDLAWLEFEKPDLDAAERFAHAFGFVTATRTADTVYLRGARAGTHSVVIRKGAKSRFVAPAFKASSRADVQKLATANNASAGGLRGPGGGVGVDLLDPSGIALRVVAGVEELPELPRQRPLVFNVGGGCTGRTRRSGRRGSRRGSSGWGTWCWRRRPFSAPWTGTWTTSA